MLSETSLGDTSYTECRYPRITGPTDHLCAVSDLNLNADLEGPKKSGSRQQPS